MNTGWICPKCGRVYAPFMCECTHCNNNEIKPDPCIITSPWSQDYSKYKSEATTDPCKCDQGVTIDDERLKYTTTTTQNLKLDKDPILFSQMICDSQGSREVDLLGRPITPINGELETLMSLEQLKELAERIPARDEEVRESSFEVMLEDEDTSPTETELKEHLYYINHITSPESENSKYEWVCSKCARKYYNFPTLGCLCGARIEEMLRVTE